MTLLHPRTGSSDPEHDGAPDVETGLGAEALIKEARRLRRRRWMIGLAVFVLIGAGIGWAASAGSNPPKVPPKTAPRHDVAARPFRPGLPVGPLATLTVAGQLAVAPTGALYVADPKSEQVLVRLPDGRYRVIAGDGTTGTAGDGGPAIDAQLIDIEDMAVGSDGSLYLVDGDRVRVVSPNGVISTIAGVPGRGTPCCSSALPPLIPDGTPAPSVSIDQMNSAAIALSPQGVLYIATGMQLLRLDAGQLDVITTRALGIPYNGQPLNNFGQIAVDAQGNVDVSGGNGWTIWRVAPDGTATELTGIATNARRSGGNTSVLERGPGGVVYGEEGSTFLKLQGGGAVASSTFVQAPGADFWLTYFAFGPGGRLYEDEIPGGEAWERYQQLRVIHGSRSTVLWRQTATDVARTASS